MSYGNSSNAQVEYVSREKLGERSTTIESETIDIMHNREREICKETQTKETERDRKRKTQSRLRERQTQPGTQRRQTSTQLTIDKHKEDTHRYRKHRANNVQDRQMNT